MITRDVTLHCPASQCVLPLVVQWVEQDDLPMAGRWVPVQGLPTVCPHCKSDLQYVERQRDFSKQLDRLEYESIPVMQQDYPRSGTPSEDYNVGE